MTDPNGTQAQLRQLVHAAGEQPGRLVTGYTADDRQALAKLADDHRRAAAQLDGLAAQAGE